MIFKLLHANSLFVTSRNSKVSLSKLLKSASGEIKTENIEKQKSGIEAEFDNMGEPFREAFLMPKEKTRVQKQLDVILGRSLKESRIPRDLDAKLAVRGPRAQEMQTDQDWPSVWPVAASFRSSVVPLPLRMGYVKEPEKRAPPGAVGNLELVKIPNFLHLTPAAIERHCNAIKKFCTNWPEEINDDCIKRFLPCEISYSDYVHQGNSLRDRRSRIVTVVFKISDFKLDKHSREKFIRLVGNRYSKETDSVSFITDRCFTRKQNLDYAMYLITALYHESIKVEPWEKLAERSDTLEIKYEGSSMQKSINEIIARISNELEEKMLADRLNEESVRKFAEDYERYRNEVETPISVKSYSEKVREFLGIPSLNAS